VKWRYEPFANLSVVELYRIIALRQRVFVVEQTCPYLDTDGVDLASDHLWTGEEPLAYLRVVPGGAKYEEPSLGRIVTAPEARGTGLGRALVIEGLARARARFGDVPVRIGAQKYLFAFYQSFGFVRAGDDYVEDGIDHVEMLRLPS